MAQHWYVIHTYSGYEDKVKASIEEQFKAKGLSAAVGELRIPTEDVVEVKAGKKRVSWLYPDGVPWALRQLLRKQPLAALSM